MVNKNIMEARTFRRMRDTKRMAVFEEQVPSGQPEVIGTLYVAKWAVGAETEIHVTVTVSVPFLQPQINV